MKPDDKNRYSHILVWGDTQFHPWQEQERPTRWREYIDTVYQELESHIERIHKTYRSDPLVVHVGDMFEAKRSIRSSVYSMVMERTLRLIKHASAGGYVFLAGNHDYYDLSYAFDPLKWMDDVFVVDEEPLVIPFHGGQDLLFVSYYTKESMIENVEKTPYKILFFHGDLHGASMGSVIARNTTLPTELLKPLPNRGIAIGGHYHQPARYEKNQLFKHVPVYYVGSPGHLNWNDADTSEDRGFLHVVLDKLSGTIEVIPLPIASLPRFYSKSTEQTRDIDFVKPSSQLQEEEGACLDDRSTFSVATSMDETLARYVQEKQAKQPKQTYREGKRLYHGRS